MSKLTEIFGRVEASMCATYGAEHPEGRVEARISRDDWAALFGMLGKKALWLVAEDGCAVLKWERAKGDWVALIREPLDGPFSHIIEPGGIDTALAADGAP